MGTKPKVLRKRIKQEEVDKISAYYKASIGHLNQRKMDYSERNERILQLQKQVAKLICPPLLEKLILSKISFEGEEINMKRLIQSTIEVRIY